MSEGRTQDAFDQLLSQVKVLLCGPHWTAYQMTRCCMEESQRQTCAVRMPLVAFQNASPSAMIPAWAACLNRQCASALDPQSTPHCTSIITTWEHLSA